MSDNWYARAKARATGQPQQPQPIAPYQGPMARGPVQPSNLPYSQGQAPVQQVQQHVQEAGPVTPEQQWGMKLAGAAMNGGEATQESPQPCPQCGGNHFFTTLPKESRSRRGPSPAPHCFDCGYNDGMFSQGMQSSWAG